MSDIGKMSIGRQSQALAAQWGAAFGNVSWARTMKTFKRLLKGDQEKFEKAYTYEQLSKCIRWLADGQKNGEVKKPITGPGVIAWVIGDFLEGKAVEENVMVGHGRRSATVRML